MPQYRMVMKKAAHWAAFLQRLSAAIDIFDFGKDVRICWAESKVVDLAGMNPSDIIVFQSLGRAGGNGTVEQCQPDQNIRILMDDLHKLLMYFHMDCQLFRALPLQRLGYTNVKTTLTGAVSMSVKTSSNCYSGISCGTGDVSTGAVLEFKNGFSWVGTGCWR